MLLQAHFEYKNCHPQLFDNFTAKTLKSQAGNQKYTTFFCPFTTHDLPIRYKGHFELVNKLLTFIDRSCRFFSKKNASPAVLELKYSVLSAYYHYCEICSQIRSWMFYGEKPDLISLRLLFDPL